MNLKLQGSMAQKCRLQAIDYHAMTNANLDLTSDKDVLFYMEAQGFEPLNNEMDQLKKIYQELGEMDITDEGLKADMKLMLATGFDPRDKKSVKEYISQFKEIG